MNRRIAALLLCLALGFGLLTVVFLPSPGQVPRDTEQIHSLQWGVNLGNVLIYKVYEKWEAYYSTYGYGSYSDIDINNTRVLFNITSLPELPTRLSNNSFIQDVVLEDKTECWYANGSPVVYPDWHNQMISQALLPVGDWEFLDYLYVSLNSPVGYYTDEYLSGFESNQFVFGRHYYDIDAVSGWEASLTLENGVPTRIVSYVDHYIRIHRWVFELESYTPAE